MAGWPPLGLFWRHQREYSWQEIVNVRVSFFKLKHEMKNSLTMVRCKEGELSEDIKFRARRASEREREREVDEKRESI